jgi:small subunit ribosomal protein S8
MSMTDPIADFLTRIRNATLRRHAQLELPGSLLKQEIAEVLKKEGFIRDWRAGHTADGKPSLSVELKYDRQGASVIRGIRRVSTPGLRRYSGYQTMSPVLSGQGISIVSTSKGVLTDTECRERKLGGEVICEVW